MELFEEFSPDFSSASFYNSIHARRRDMLCDGNRTVYVYDFWGDLRWWSNAGKITVDSP